MKRATRNPIQTRQAIIERSAAIFNAHGIAGTSMQMLVKATGYQMGGIYRHFATKKDLAKAVFEYNAKHIVLSTFEMEGTLNPKEKIEKVLYKYQRMTINPMSVTGCPIMNLAMETDDTDEDMRLLAKSAVDTVIESLTLILKEGQEQGLFQSNFQPRQEALYIFASFEGAIMVGKTTKDGPSFMAIFGSIQSYIKRCIFV